MKVVAYRINLLEPVLVTALEGDPNSAISHNYLPGSVLKGTLIGLAMKQAKLSELDITKPDIRRRFFDGNTRFLNGYLMLAGKRSLPAPRSWEQSKYAENDAQIHQILDRALSLTERQETLDEQKPKGKTKSLAGEFTVSSTNDSSKVYVAEPQHVINIHTERERKLGRSVGKGEGTIYRYDALKDGQTFEALILCEEDSDAEYFAKLLTDNSPFAIGGARNAGYGRVELDEVQVKEPKREVEGTLAAPSNSLVLTLLSDIILRDKYGQYSPDVPTFLTSLAARLGVDPEHLSIEKVLKSESIAGGFNRKWGLPLPQVQTLEMGSVFVVDLTRLSEAERAVLLEKLQSLEWLGLGERRSDGFGRVAVGWQQHEKLEKSELAQKPSSQEAVTLSEESKLLWQQMEKRIQRRTVDQSQLKLANELKLANLPPTSQLNRLRQRVTSELLKTSPTTDVVTYFLTDISGKRAGKYFEQAKIDTKSMKDWLKEQEKASDKYASLRLIDAMLAKAAKQSQKDKKQREG